MTTGRREDRLAVIKEWGYLTDSPEDADRLRLHEAFTDWCWLTHSRGRPFDFGDEAEFRRGIDLLLEMVRKRFNRARPSTPSFARLNFGVRALLYRLKANIDRLPVTAAAYKHYVEVIDAQEPNLEKLQARFTEKKRQEQAHRKEYADYLAGLTAE